MNRAPGPSTSPHILSTSSNLLGLCFVVLTSLHVLKLTATTVIDELTSGSIILFMTSSILAFLSLRSSTRRSLVYEKFADGFFLSGLTTMFVTTMFIALKLVK